MPTFVGLSDTERETWDRDGFLVLPAVFDADEVSALTAAADRLEQRVGGLSTAAGEAFERTNIVEDDELFLDLIDHQRLLGAAMDLMGAAVQLLVSTVTFRPRLDTPAIRWHTDDPSPYFFPRIAGTCPVWQLKCAVYLTDVTEPDMGNFVAAPGSHRSGMPVVSQESQAVLTKDRYRTVPDIAGAVSGARQVTARAGDVLMFHPALWHTVAANRSDRIRKNLWYVYGPLWMRLGDRLASSDALVARSSPIRRQLLGATVGAHRSSLAPQDEGAPLIRAWEGRTYNEVWQSSLDALLAQWWGHPGRVG
jgi:ectoine hydroxylase